jgi:phenylpropionate dioxygenase-like ring-hydroxylating dioxygenase large terminal subunit
MKRPPDELSIPEPKSGRLRAGTYDASGTQLVEALPAFYYTDPRLFDLEKQKIFAKAWQCLGHVGMAKKAGDYFTGKILDQEILFVRADDGELRAFHNVCQHRAHTLVSGSGHTRLFVCPYHAWTYGLNGELKKVPSSKNIANCEFSGIQLKPVRLELFCGLVFVNLDESARAFRDEYGFLESNIRELIPNIEQQTLVFEEPIVHRANWKASVENFSECYHCAPVHKYLTSSVIDADSYKLTIHGRSQRHFIRGLEAGLEQHLWFIWPNTAFGLYPIPGFGMAFCIRHMYPVKIDETIYHYRWFAPDGANGDSIVEYAREHAASTGAEDAAVAGGAQRGMNSLGFSQGLLLATPDNSSTSEHAIASFHRWVVDALQA